MGNHDHPFSFGKTNAFDIFGQIPLDGFYVISKPMSLTLTTKSGPVNIVGIPWPTRNTIALSDEHMHATAATITDYISAGVSIIIKNLAERLDPTHYRQFLQVI